MAPEGLKRDLEVMVTREFDPALPVTLPSRPLSRPLSCVLDPALDLPQPPPTTSSHNLLPLLSLGDTARVATLHGDERSE